MNASNPDPFESRLSSQPLRRPPPEWRSEILVTSSRAQLASAQSPARGDPRGFIARLSEILWPSPVAWGGLAAVWLALLAFNATSSANTRATANASSPSAEQLQYTFRDQTQLLEELIGPYESAESKRRPPPVIKPRTQLQSSCATA